MNVKSMLRLYAQCKPEALRVVFRLIKSRSDISCITYRLHIRAQLIPTLFSPLLLYEVARKVAEHMLRKLCNRNELKNINQTDVIAPFEDSRQLKSA